jgi:hypothetical protein
MVGCFSTQVGVLTTFGSPVMRLWLLLLSRGSWEVPTTGRPATHLQRPSSLQPMFRGDGPSVGGGSSQQWLTSVAGSFWGACVCVPLRWAPQQCFDYCTHP